MKDNRKAAMNDMDMHYFTGKKCINGHIAKRLTENGTCLPCESERVRNKRISNARMKRLKRTVGEAKENKDRFYFTGKPCKNGHISIRRTVNWLCEECKKQRNAKKRKNDIINIERKKQEEESNAFILLFYAIAWVNREKRDVMERWEEEKNVESLTS